MPSAVSSTVDRVLAENTVEGSLLPETCAVATALANVPAGAGFGMTMRQNSGSTLSANAGTTKLSVHWVAPPPS